jgi:hypothetical protein
MSVNAFYDAYSATQNALGDPRGDAERRRQQEMQNAMQQRQMQMREFQFGQEQQEAQRAEQVRQAQMARARAQMQFRGGSMYPNQQPQQAAPAAPMTDGAPIQAMPQGQSFVDDATGKEGASYTATATQRGPAPTQEEELDFLMREAYNRGDIEGFNQYFDVRRQNMSAEEKAGRQQIAVVAGQIARLPDDQLAAAVVQAMQQFGIDPATTKIDDYLNNPAQLRRALQLEMALGAPDDAAKANIDVDANRQKQMDEQRYAPVSALNLGNQQLLYGGTGNEVGRYNVGVSPNTALQSKTQIRTAGISATGRVNAAKGAASVLAASGKLELVQDDDIPEDKK